LSDAEQAISRNKFEEKAVLNRTQNKKKELDGAGK
jgi:hypothetical protein